MKPENKILPIPATANRLSQEESDRIQRILMNSDKMASLGQLIAGVAHELNNPISFIESNVIFLQKYFGDLRKLLALYESGATHEELKGRTAAFKKEMEFDFAMADLENILKSFDDGASRIRSIIGSLSAFSRGERQRIEAMNVHDAIDNTINLLQHKYRHTVVFQKEYKAYPILVANRGEINQVLMNLIINAVHAIQHKFSEGQKGTIAVATSSANERVRIDVRDNGEGIPAENLGKIFQAFFTTKKDGEGTGLGLPISKEIVEKHQGEIRVESTTCEGTTFSVILPVGREENETV